MRLARKNNKMEDMKFILNRFESRKQQKEAYTICKKFNGMNIRTIDGMRLEMRVKRR